MPVIKHANAERLTRSALVLDLGDLQRQADEIIASAQREAAKIRQDAQREADALVAAGDARGYDDGLDRGLEEGRARGRTEGQQTAGDEERVACQALAQSWQRALEVWDEERASMRLDAKEDILTFAVALARRVVHRVVETDLTVVDDQLTSALTLLAGPTSVTIVVNPDDHARIEAMLPDLRERFEACTDARIDDDPEITRGGCMLRTGRGSIDATIETQLDRIAASLLGERMSEERGA